ncbi:L domain-like protein [Athelia psychrophila]|uniref:L domain-like protein n=1 Tax=Athelia psychrophila TaxID=1759441 RepID=A0A166UG88_9AGAM|nr:L domain-like protein [Fibularhizoctonia sp. CBS 109695]
MSTPQANGTPLGDAPAKKTARVVLPSAEPEVEDDHEVSEDELEEGHIENADDDTDYLGEFPDETDELNLLHQRIGSLKSLRLERFAKHLKRLCLRQNFISFLDPEVFSLLTEMEELDFYDNKLKTVGDALNTMSKLTVLDLSFNLLKSVPETLVHLKLLDTVYFVQNRISRISGLESVGATLRSLELGGNKLRRIENLDALVNLEELWLGKNKISKLENLGSLKRLKILSIQSNRITKIENLESLENLEDIYLSHNGVKKLEGLDHNLKLKTLDLGSNFVPDVENIVHLTRLEEVWLNNNKITTLQTLEPQLRTATALETIYLEGNPVQESEGGNYRRKIKMALPQLSQIDATYVKPA